MKNERELKNLRFQVKDAEKGLVTAVFATFNVKDHDGDYTLPGAFDDSAEVIISAYGHGSWRGALPVGKGVIRMEEKRAVLEGQFFLNTMAGKETFETIKEVGGLQEWSYGFDVIETGDLGPELRAEGVWRVIKKANVYEVSPVIVGAGIDTGTLATKARKEAQEREDKDRADMLTAGRKEFVKFTTTMATLAKTA